MLANLLANSEHVRCHNLIRMATIQLDLDRRRKKVDDTYPLVFKITCNRKQVMINTGISIKELDFDSENGIIIDTRLILSVALKSLASSIILSHNHPSGNLVPSEVDKKITKQLKNACKLLEITLLDHIILAPDNAYYSFIDEGLF